MKNRYRFALNLIWACGLLVSPADGANPFSLTINYTGDSAYQHYFTEAEAIWERIIPSYINGNWTGAGPFTFTGITISAKITSMDGVGGVLGSAGWQTGHYDDAGYALAQTGAMQFDSADVGGLGFSFQTVILHEMAHVIGLGTIWTYNAGLYTTAGQYTGAAGLAAYKTEFNQPAATFVPVELGGGAGTAGGHWNEVDGGGVNTGFVSNSNRDMRYELMTGWLDVDKPSFISSLTRASLQDIGYNTRSVWDTTKTSGTWGDSANWLDGLPTALDIATFPSTSPSAGVSVGLGVSPQTIDTLQFDNNASVTIHDGSLSVSNINSTSTGITKIQGVAITGKPNLTLASSSILKFLDAAGTASAAVTVGNVSGGGTIEGDITIEGTDAPGGSGTVGSQAFTGNLTYANGSIFEWDLGKSSVVDVDGTQFDRVSVTGNIAVGADTIFRVVLGGAALSDILNPANAFWNTPYGTQSWSMSSIFGEAFSSGWFSSVQVANYVSSYGSFSITPTNLVWTAVPEMTTLDSGLLLLLGTFRRRRGA
jgi:hypothetical protein